MSKTKTHVIDARRCKSCGLCVDACPKGVLAIGTEINGKDTIISNGASGKVRALQHLRRGLSRCRRRRCGRVARNAFSGVFRRSLLRFRNGGVPVTENAYMESIMSDLIPLFRPKSVALIGASSDTKKYGYWTAKSLIDNKFQGEIHLISRSGGEILGQPTYPISCPFPAKWILPSSPSRPSTSCPSSSSAWRRA